MEKIVLYIFCGAFPSKDVNDVGLAGENDEMLFDALANISGFCSEQETARWINRRQCC